MRGRPQLTPEKLAKARELRAAGHSYKKIAAEVGLSCGSMARQWLDPNYAEYRRERVRQYRKGFAISPLRVADRAIAETAGRLLAAIPPDTRDLTGRLLGDPLPGRRAIDRREMKRGKYEVPFQ